jgi:hypothetical protein
MKLRPIEKSAELPPVPAGEEENLVIDKRRRTSQKGGRKSNGSKYRSLPEKKEKSQKVEPENNDVAVMEPEDVEVVSQSEEGESSSPGDSYGTDRSDLLPAYEVVNLITRCKDISNVPYASECSTRVPDRLEELLRSSFADIAEPIKSKFNELLSDSNLDSFKQLKEGGLDDNNIIICVSRELTIENVIPLVHKKLFIVSQHNNNLYG